MFAHLRRHCLLWKTMVWLEFTLWERTDLPNKKIGPRVSLNLLISTDWPCSYFQTQFSRTGPALIGPLGMNTAPGSRSFSGRFFEAASATAAATWVFPVPAARTGASRCATFSKCHDAIWPHLVALAPNCISWTWWSPTARGFQKVAANYKPGRRTTKQSAVDLSMGMSQVPMLVKRTSCKHLKS